MGKRLEIGSNHPSYWVWKEARTNATHVHFRTYKLGSSDTRDRYIIAFHVVNENYANDDNYSNKLDSSREMHLVLSA